MSVILSNGDTIIWCCTSFVKSGGGLRRHDAYLDLADWTAGAADSMQFAQTARILMPSSMSPDLIRGSTRPYAHTAQAEA
jgi:hypothetical protein